MNSRYLDRVPKGSIMMAPMEGVTDGPYRKTIAETFGGWDFYFCDFLRIPSAGSYKVSKIKEHMGNEYFVDPEVKRKTGFQILASSKSNIEEHLEKLNELGVDWLDLNLGCPSKKVNGHKGGAYLLDDVEEMARLVSRIRKNWKPIFTCKIRLGYKNTNNFETILKTLEGLGVEAITIHGRTKEQLYKGVANWSYIAKAVKLVDLPIIGNGDIWTPLDIKRIFDQTGCHGAMVARGAMKTPWLAQTYKAYRSSLQEVSQDEDFLLSLRERNIKKYFRALNLSYDILQENHRLKRFKGLSRYTFDDFEFNYKSQLLRSENLNQFISTLKEL